MSFDDLTVEAFAAVAVGSKTQVCMLLELSQLLMLGFDGDIDDGHQNKT